MKTEYRADIDGLRAVAVLLVVAFHAFPKHVTGGFVGVDIFFVISGFLISGIIYKGLADGDFGFLAFYARRIKRIFPALIVVLIASAIVGWLILFPFDYRVLGKHIAAGAGSVENFAYLQEAGYFDTAAELKPLLHLWSLGVEEQFYIVWPLLVVLAWPYRKAPIAVAAIIFAISLIWCVALTATDPAAAFYLPFTRFWELMLGCMLAFAVFGAGRASSEAADGNRLALLYRRHQAAIRETASWLGATLIVASAALITARSAFPGWWALMPTMGAALLIFAGANASLNRYLLSHRAVVYVGLISYPLYLWHWPILVFLRTVSLREPSDLMRVAAIGAAFGLAHLTYRYIERPIRFGAPLSYKPIAASCAMAFAGGFGLFVFATNGIPSRFPPQAQVLSRNFVQEAMETNRSDACFILRYTGVKTFAPACDPPPRPDVRTVALLGDSHASHLYPGLAALQRASGTFQIAQYNAAGCPPVYLVPSGKQKECQAINDAVIGKVVKLKPDTVILAANWSSYSTLAGSAPPDNSELRALVPKLRSIGVKRIVAVGQFPVWRVFPVRIRALMYRRDAWGFSAAAASPMRDRDKSYLDPATFTHDAQFKALLSVPGVTVVSPISTLCNGDGCLLVVPDGSGEPMVWDYAHLTEAGSKFFVKANADALVGSAKTAGR
ncbi:MAG: acyltransferase family protein [Xanthobacteraceae bacterium]